MDGREWSALQKNLMPAKFSEHSFGNAKFLPSWIISVLNEGKFEVKWKSNWFAKFV